MTAFPALAAWRRRGDTATCDGLWRAACWESAAADLRRQGCLEPAGRCAGIARVISADPAYFPNDENDRILPDGTRRPGPMERRGLVSKPQFRALMRDGRRALTPDAVDDPLLAELDRDWRERLAQLQRRASPLPGSWGSGKAAGPLVGGWGGLR